MGREGLVGQGIEPRKRTKAHLTGGIYKGSQQHASLKEGSDEAQLNSLSLKPEWSRRVRNMTSAMRPTSASGSLQSLGSIYRRFLRQPTTTLRHRITANSGTSTMTKMRTFLSTAMSRSILSPVTGFLFLGFPGHAFIDQNCVAVRLSQSDAHVILNT